ncbi:hypothetical protein BGX38DRAFT_773775 [Terfezia claveryi]|nr:hypothetical protein BGX38DRAFT_773775 [Terfezia claveryi]
MLTRYPMLLSFFSHSSSASSHCSIRLSYSLSVGMWSVALSCQGYGLGGGVGCWCWLVGVVANADRVFWELDPPSDISLNSGGTPLRAILRFCSISGNNSEGMEVPLTDIVALLCQYIP